LHRHVELPDSRCGRVPARNQESKHWQHDHRHQKQWSDLVHLFGPTHLQRLLQPHAVQLDHLSEHQHGHGCVRRQDRHQAYSFFLAGAQQVCEPQLLRDQQQLPRPPLGRVLHEPVEAQQVPAHRPVGDDVHAGRDRVVPDPDAVQPAQPGGTQPVRDADSESAHGTDLYGAVA